MAIILSPNLLRDPYKDQYKEKLVSADEAVKIVKSGDWVQYGEFVMQPKDLDAALARRVNELEDVKIRAVTMTMMPEIVKVDPDRKHFVFNDWHYSGITRALQDKGLCNYISLTYHEAPKILREFCDVDVAFIPVAPMDSNGFFNIGTSNSINSYVRAKAKKVIVEVNKSVPRCLGAGGESVHISEVDYIVESSSNPKLFHLPEVPVSDTDRKIANIVLGLMEDGACLQLGIGSMPNVIGSLITDSDFKDLGVHSEMLADSYVDMYESGRVNGKRKNLDKGKMVYTFAMGTDKLYNFLDKDRKSVV